MAGRAGTQTGRVRDSLIAFAASAIALAVFAAPGHAATTYPTGDGSDGACVFNEDGALNTNNDTYFRFASGTSQPIGNDGVFNCTSLTVADDVQISVFGESSTLDFRVTGTADIQGDFVANGVNGGQCEGGSTAGGAGGVCPAGGGGGQVTGASPGQSGFGPNPGIRGTNGGGAGGLNGGGGGGGGFAGGGGGAGSGATHLGGSGGGTGGPGGGAAGAAGQAGTGGSGTGATPGEAVAPGSGGGGGGGGGYGNPATFHPGSGGGGGGSGSNAGVGGGGGGGAVRIIAGGTVTLSNDGKILANGGSTPGLFAGSGGIGGGGSGGAVWLTSPTVSVAGGSTLSAVGGLGGFGFSGGGGGNGSGGSISITTNALTGSGDITPAAASARHSWELSVTRAGSGTGTVTSTSPDGGIDCGGDCSDPYDPGATVTLTATPAPGSQFTGWSGACANAAGDCTVTMDQARSVTASFAGPQTQPPGGSDTTTTPEDGGTTPTADRQAPRLTLGGKAAQRLGRVVKVNASCDEACAVEATGKLVIRPRSGEKLRIALKPASASLAAGQLGKFKLKVGKKKLERAMSSAPWSKASARVAVKATDAAGNAATAKRKVKLKP